MLTLTPASYIAPSKLSEPATSPEEPKSSGDVQNVMVNDGLMMVNDGLYIYTDGHRVRTSKIFQNLVALQLEPKNFAHLEPWFAKGSDSGGNTNQL